MAPRPTKSQYQARRSQATVPVPFKEWIPSNQQEDRAVLINCDKTGALCMMLINQRTVGDFKKNRPSEARITIKEFMEFAHASEDGVIKALRRLQVVGAIKKRAKTTDPYSRDNEGLRDLAAKELPPPRKVTRPECRPRTEPDADEEVQLETPAGFAVISVTCPDHATGHVLIYKGFVDNKDVMSHEQYSSIAPVAAPDASPPEAKPPDPEPAASISAVTAAEVGEAVAPLCYEVWGKSPADGPLLNQTATALRDGAAIPFLKARIEMCRGRRNKEMGLLPKLAAAAFQDLKLSRQVESTRRETYQGLLIHGRIPQATWEAMSDAEREKWKELAP